MASENIDWLAEFFAWFAGEKSIQEIDLEKESFVYVRLAEPMYGVTERRIKVLIPSSALASRMPWYRANARLAFPEASPEVAGWQLLGVHLDETALTLNRALSQIEFLPEAGFVPSGKPNARLSTTEVLPAVGGGTWVPMKKSATGRRSRR